MLIRILHQGNMQCKVPKKKKDKHEMKDQKETQADDLIITW